MKIRTLWIWFFLLLSAWGPLNTAVLSQPSNRIDSLKKVIRSSEHDTTNVKALIALGRLLVNSNPDSSRIFLHQALEIAEHHEWKKGIGKAYYRLGSLNRRLGNYNEGIQTMKKALEIFQQLANSKQIAKAKTGLGSIYNEQGDYPEALDNFMSAQQIHQMLEDSQGLANNYLSIGIVYYKQGIYPKALDYYLKALKLNKQLNNQQALSRNYGVIGIVHKDQRNIPEALEYYQKALEISKRLGQRKLSESWLGNIGNIYAERGDYIIGIRHYLKALNITKDIGLKNHTALWYANLAENLIKASSEPDSVQARIVSQFFSKSFEERTLPRPHTKTILLDTAYSLLQQGLVINRSIGDRLGLTFCYESLGNIHKERNNYQRALFYYKKEYHLTDSIGYLKGKMGATNHISEIYRALGDTKQALEWQDQFIFLKDSLFNQNKQEEIGRLQGRFESEMKMLKMRKEQEKQEMLAREQHRRQRTIIWSVSAGLGLVLISLLLLYNRFRVTHKQKEIIEDQKKTVDQKNKEITDSINYAQRIQSAILTAENELQKAFGNDYFILFKPKEVVSGDFYWAYQNKDQLIWTAADCTGHGVPGAFMSMIGHQLLNKTVIEKGITDPGAILNRLRVGIIDTLKQRGQEGEMRDGMDMALVKYQIPNSKSQTRKIEFSGAKNPLYIVGEDIAHRPVAKKADKTDGTDLIEIVGDKQPIGYEQEDHQPFTTHTIELQPGDKLYTFSDGFPDQFGGPKGKKFMYKRFKKLLCRIQEKEMEEQKRYLDKTIEDWMAQNSEEQVDDICVMGVKIR